MAEEGGEPPQAAVQVVLVFGYEEKAKGNIGFFVVWWMMSLNGVEKQQQSAFGIQ